MKELCLVLAYKLAFMVYVTWDESYSCGVQSSSVSASEGILEANKLRKLELGRMSLFAKKIYAVFISQRSRSGHVNVGENFAVALLGV